MRIRQFALVAVVVLGLSGCSAAADLGTGIVDGAKSQSDIIMKTDLSNAMTAIVAMGTDQPGAFPSDISELETWGYTPSEGQQPVTFSGDAADFCIQGVAESGTTFHLALQGAVEEGACP